MILNGALKAIQRHIQVIGKSIAFTFILSTFVLFLHYTAFMNCTEEKQGYSRDDILNKIVGSYNSSQKVPGANIFSEEREIEMNDEVTKHLEDADTVFDNIRQACDKAQSKMDTLIAGVKTKFTELASAVDVAGISKNNAKNSDPAHHTEEQSHVASAASNRNKMHVLLDDLASTKQMLASKEKEFAQAQRDLKVAGETIEELTLSLERENGKLTDNLRVTENQLKVLLDTGKNEQRNVVDAGLEVHIEQSRAAREAEQAKDILSKHVLKGKKLAKEVEALQKELAELKEKFNEEQTKNIKLQEHLDEVSG